MGRIIPFQDSSPVFALLPFHHLDTVLGPSRVRAEDWLLEGIDTNFNLDGSAVFLTGVPGAW